MSILTKEQMRAILREYKVTTADDINRVLKDLFGGLLQEALEAELDTELEYPKNGSIPEGKTNRRNGHTNKTVRSERGEIALSVPRDREGEFEPVIVKKHQKEVTGIEEQILALYARDIGAGHSSASASTVWDRGFAHTDFQRNQPDYALDKGMAVEAAVADIRRGVSGRYPLQGQTGGSHCQQGCLYGHRH